MSTMVFLLIVGLPILVAFGFLLFGLSQVKEKPGRYRSYYDIDQVAETLRTFGLQALVALAIAGVSVGAIYWRNTTDTELINGVVTAKKMEVVGCRHPYCCGTCQSCDSKGNCTSYCCAYCNEHPFDQDWNVFTNAGGKDFRIDTLDSQGLREPPRWTATQIGEPVSWEHSYTNYIKAAPGTLFSRDAHADEKKFPLPPGQPEVFDYWHTNQFYQVGIVIPDAAEWTAAINTINGQIGPAHQATLTVVVVKDQPREYFDALNSYWIGGKKNQVTLVVSVDDQLNIQWSDVMAWSYNEMVRVEMRDSMTKLGHFTRETVLQVAESNINRNFARKHMADFKYLEATIAPTGFQYFLSIFLGTLFVGGLGVFIYKYKD